MAVPPAAAPGNLLESRLTAPRVARSESGEAVVQYALRRATSEIPLIPAGKAFQPDAPPASPMAHPAAPHAVRALQHFVAQGSHFPPLAHPRLPPADHLSVPTSNLGEFRVRHFAGASSAFQRGSYAGQGGQASSGFPGGWATSHSSGPPSVVWAQNGGKGTPAWGDIDCQMGTATPLFMGAGGLTSVLSSPTAHMALPPTRASSVCSVPPPVTLPQHGVGCRPRSAAGIVTGTPLPLPSASVGSLPAGAVAPTAYYHAEQGEGSSSEEDDSTLHGPIQPVAVRGASSVRMRAPVPLAAFPGRAGGTHAQPLHTHTLGGPSHTQLDATHGLAHGHFHTDRPFSSGAAGRRGEAACDPVLAALEGEASDTEF